MEFYKKEVELNDGSKCILRSPNENDAKDMIEYLKITSDETHFMIRYPHRATFGISIKEKYWNKGIGSILIEEIIKEARKMGYEQIELGVFSDNEKAKRLYEKSGFQVWGKNRNAFKLKDGRYFDEIIMGIML